MYLLEGIELEQQWGLKFFQFLANNEINIKEVVMWKQSVKFYWKVVPVIDIKVEMARNNAEYCIYIIMYIGHMML